MSAYRSPANVPVYVAPLQARIWRQCPACEVTFGTVNPKDIFVRNSVLRETFCVGRGRGFLWLGKACREHRAHLHQLCLACGAAWIAAPATEAMFAERESRS